jgi:hypothetical protein
MIGIIVECGPDGADKAVTQYLAGRIVAGVRVRCVTLDNKKQLITNCGDAAAGLLSEGCVGVIIVWDLHPGWNLGGSPPCRHNDRESIAASLITAGVRLELVHLVCITEELEAWLLADGRAVSAVLSTDAHRVRVKDEKQPDRVPKPKTKLMKIFQQETHKPYVDRYHAIKIVEELPDLTKIRRSDSFSRFEERIQRMTP